MSKLAAIAERIKDTKTRLDAEADKLAERLDAVDAKAPGAFDGAHAFLAKQDAEIQAIEDTMRQLSNLPLGESGASRDGQKG